MARRKWIWATLLALPLAMGSVWAYVQLGRSATYTCPMMGRELPCPNCCPARQEYVCPITGEVLPCPNCCPLSQR
ncbi:hypothetical protein HRbin36_01137 [bacterium HR36]|nr:hypothetical protein HRbin36_01137 [bacterium HR36]